MRTLLLLAGFSLLGADPKWVRIPAGSFTMGCEPASECPEKLTPRLVRFDKPFELQRTEVTVGEFRRFVQATGYRTYAEEIGFAWSWSKPRSYELKDDLPVTYVNLKDAASYCKWVDARLPTEPEWTYAFRAGGETVQGHLWWDLNDKYVWSRRNSKATLHPVGTRKANRWGLHDMEGSVWEWTLPAEWDQAKAELRGGSWVSCQFIEGKPKESGAEMGRFTKCPSDGVVHYRDDIGFRCAR